MKKEFIEEISRSLNIKEKGMIEKEIIKKTILALEKYERYRDNLKAKEKAFSEDFFKWGEEKNLLLKEINEKDFYIFLNKLSDFLNKILSRLKANKPTL